MCRVLWGGGAAEGEQAESEKSEKRIESRSVSPPTSVSVKMSEKLLKHT